MDRNLRPRLRFLSTPSGWRATAEVVLPIVTTITISIHALRVEGDMANPAYGVSIRPDISIHALRVEGDMPQHIKRSLAGMISIHALRVEGDRRWIETTMFSLYFYPRPPGGGRLFFLRYLIRSFSISIHALRVEGDAVRVYTVSVTKYFYPRPPGGGRRSNTPTSARRLTFLSTPSGWRATTFKKLIYSS